MIGNFSQGNWRWDLKWRRNKLTEAAESIHLPTFVVADVGRTQVVFHIWVKIKNNATLKI